VAQGKEGRGSVNKETVMVRAKFKLTSIKRHEGSKQVDVPAADGKPAATKWEPCEVRTIEMSPVFGNGDPNHENTKFWNASPSGSLTLTMINLEAAEQFGDHLGAEFYLDFTPAK